MMSKRNGNCIKGRMDQKRLIQVVAKQGKLEPMMMMMIMRLDAVESYLAYYNFKPVALC